MKMALYIMSIFSSQPNVVMSWGVSKFGALQGDTGIVFHARVIGSMGGSKLSMMKVQTYSTSSTSTIRV
jgi:hypothetical protein